ncbi:hypothetical protein [Flavicella sediminum]|uniref:hypothetical protein n=1 Tax=Flavicella sediminum TaxID=2585141 RepID=UPI00112039CE|nr:hypothetical protein [Flavicella sediminum]
MRISLLLLTLILTIGCATRNIKYDRNKILKKYQAGYKIFVDEKVEKEFLIAFLDKDNIKNVRINRRTKEVKISQIKPTKLLKMKDWNLDSLSIDRKNWSKEEIKLMIIDDVLMTGKVKEMIKIDPNAIKSIKILRKEKIHKLNLCGHYKGETLLITIK